MTTEAIATGRISAFVRWVARTPWPVFTLGMLQADIIGALLVLGFLRFGLPAEDRIQLQDLPAFNLLELSFVTLYSSKLVNHTMGADGPYGSFRDTYFQP